MTEETEFLRVPPISECLTMNINQLFFPKK